MSSSACVHMYKNCPSEYEYRIVAIGNMDKRDLCCMKCGHSIQVDKWDRWDTIVASWMDNGFHPDDWVDYNDACMLKPGRALSAVFSDMPVIMDDK